MIDHADWITRIEEQAEDLEGKVFDVAQFVRDAGGWSGLPAVYVYPYRDEAGNVYQVVDTQAGRQSVLAVVAVLIVVQASTGESGAQAFDTLQGTRAAIRDALTQWIPDGAYDEVRFAGGQSEEIINDCLVWEDRYVTRCFV